ncbi:hypothetical protein IWQ62_000213 [Dispira parvispora]|uniref:Pentacotripeptide-repeat region of PRORP domain-containing protein n=1 Tax=Dispira parvispora TaxID=1520584 RepID=A0A9W8AV82_9FUNG|nr:hypothetical protein IWQ62_000213 [Dispira parvispora]
MEPTTKKLDQPELVGPERVSKLYAMLESKELEYGKPMASDETLSLENHDNQVLDAPQKAGPEGADRLTDELLAKPRYLDTRVNRLTQRTDLSVDDALKAGLLPGIDTKGNIPTAEFLRDVTATPTLTQPAPSRPFRDHDIHMLSPVGESAPRYNANLSVKRFNQVLYANALAGRPEEAEKVLDLMKEYGMAPDARCYFHLMDAYANRNNLRGVITTLRRAEQAEIPVGIHCYGVLIKSYVRALRLDDALAVYDILKKKGIRPTQPIYTQLIKACLDVGHFDRSWEIFEHMRYEVSQPDEVAFSLMIHACAKRNQVEKAINLFEEMIEVGLSVTDVTFNSLISACARNPTYYRTSLRLVDQMSQHGIAPDSYTFTTLILACALAKDFNRARSLFLQMVSEAAEKGSTHLSPNFLTYKNLFLAYTNAFEPVVSRQLRRQLDTIESRRARNLPCSLRLPADLQSLVNRPIPDFARPDPSSLSTDQVPVENDAPTAVVSSEETNRGAVPVVPEVEHAQTLWSRLKSIGLNQPLNSRAQILREAEDVFQLMMQLPPVPSTDLPITPPNPSSTGVQTASPYQYSTKLLNTFLDMYAQYGQVEQAFALVERTYPQLGITPNGWTYKSLLMLCSREHSFERGQMIWKRYQQWAREHENSLNQPVPIEGAAPFAPGQTLSLEQQLNVRSALEKRVERERAGRGANDELRTYQFMIDIFAKQDNLAAAVQLVKDLVEIPYHEHRPPLTRFKILYDKTIALGDIGLRGELLRLCPPEDKTVRYTLARKWGSKVPWDVGLGKRQVLIEQSEGDWT